MSKQAQIQKDFLEKRGAEGYLQKIREVVSTHRGSQIQLKNADKYSFKVGALADTSYKDEPEMLEEWQEFYLPDHMFMEVIGVMENFPCNAPDGELVLMLCEDGKVFAYEDDRLHLVSENLKELFTSGLKFPGTEQYYRGKSFEDMKDEDWHKVRESKEGRAMRKEHQEMLKDMKVSYLRNLDVIMGRGRGEMGPAARGPEPVPVHL